jgi:hypothetical protein
VPLSALFQLYGGGQCHFQHYFSYMVVVSATFSTISVISAESGTDHHHITEIVLKVALTTTI